MKRVLIPILFLISACHETRQEKAFVKAQADSGVADKNKQAIIRKSQKDTINNDTVYKISSFLICADKKMKFEIISKKHPSKSTANKRDTLYNDKDTLILGDYNEGMLKRSVSAMLLGEDSLQKEGVYKKCIIRPEFSAFKVNNIYTGKPAAPNFKTDPGAGYYKKMISENGGLAPGDCEKNWVNFAGHYSLEEWARQGETQFLAIVDRIDGRVFHKFPFGVFNYYYGLRYSKDSRMLIINSDLLDIFPGYRLVYYAGEDCSSFKPAVYVWNDSVFKRVE